MKTRGSGGIHTVVFKKDARICSKGQHTCLSGRRLQPPVFTGNAGVNNGTPTPLNRRNRLLIALRCDRDSRINVHHDVQEISCSAPSAGAEFEQMHPSRLEDAPMAGASSHVL